MIGNGVQTLQETVRGEGMLDKNSGSERGGSHLPVKAGVGGRQIVSCSPRKPVDNDLR